MKNGIKIALSCIVLTSVVACSPVTAQRGSLLEDYQIAEVRVGESSRSDVLRLIGSPTTQSTFNQDVWYYIGQKTAKHGILDSEVVNERIVKVAFNSDGIVESISDEAGNRIDLPYTRAKTPTHGSELTFTQQLLGNMGRFNAPQN